MLAIVKPATVIGWHRRGFAWFWATQGKVLQGQRLLHPEERPGGSNETSEDAQHGPAAMPWPTRMFQDLAADEFLVGTAGENPLSVVQRMARQLGEDDAIELSSSFRPEPLLGILRDQGFAFYCREESPESFRTVVKGR